MEGHHDISIRGLCFFPLSCCLSLAFLANWKFWLGFVSATSCIKHYSCTFIQRKPRDLPIEVFHQNLHKGCHCICQNAGGKHKPCKCSCEGACIRVHRGFFASPNLLWCFWHRMSRKWSLTNMFDRGFLPVTYLLILTTSQTAAYDCSYILVPSFCWSSSSLQKPDSENIIRPLL